MKFATRIKFTLGICITVALCMTLFIYLDYSMSRIRSIDAQLESDYYAVGVDYSGIVEKQLVEEGDYIKTNDPLFELRSPTLTDAIKNNEIAKSSLLYSVTKKGTILISAAASGRIQTINYRKGAFVPANSEVAIVNAENSLYVSATYKLSSPDYARINTKSRISVTLPDNKHIDGTVYDISLDTTNKEVLTTVRARIDQSAVNQIAFSVGTPVESTLYLDTDTWYSRISSGVTSLFKPGTGE